MPREFWFWAALPAGLYLAWLRECQLMLQRPVSDYVPPL
jgi:hypothetical protein